MINQHLHRYSFNEVALYQSSWDHFRLLSSIHIKVFPILFPWLMDIHLSDRHATFPFSNRWDLMQLIFWNTSNKLKLKSFLTFLVVHMHESVSIVTGSTRNCRSVIYKENTPTPPHPTPTPKLHKFEQPVWPWPFNTHFQTNDHLCPIGKESNQKCPCCRADTTRCAIF